MSFFLFKLGQILSYTSLLLSSKSYLTHRPVSHRILLNSFKHHQMKLSKWATEKGISYQTAYRLFKNGYLPSAYQLPTGTILVDVSETKKDLKIEVLEKQIELMTDLNKSMMERIKNVSGKPEKILLELEKLRQLKKRLMEQKELPE